MFKPFKYSSFEIPTEYICSNCGAQGVRLFREWQTFLNHQTLLCQDCSIAEQERQPAQNETTIGWRVAAVPTEDGITFWGYTAVPQEGVDWWYHLPIYSDVINTFRKEA